MKMKENVENITVNVKGAYYQATEISVACVPSQ